MTPGAFDVHSMRRRLDDAQFKGLDVDYWRQALDAFDAAARGADELEEIRSDLESAIDELTIEPSDFVLSLGMLDDLDGLSDEHRAAIEGAIDEKNTENTKRLKSAIDELKATITKLHERLGAELDRERPTIQGRNDE